MIPTLFNTGLMGKPASGAGAVGGWVELGRTTLGGASSTIDVTSLADKRYYMVLHSVVGKNTVTVDDAIRLGNSSFDTGSNYARRRSVNGGTDSTATSQSSALLASSDTNPQFDVSYMANRSANEKLGITHRAHQATAGAANAPNRQEFVWKWTNTSNPIDRWRFWSGGSDTFNSGSEVVVLGWDPADTHTNNFWEELASVNASASSTSINTGTFTAKKYLWIQAYVNATGADMSVTGATVNSDVGSNYANRFSDNGGADSTITSNQNLVILDGGSLAQNVGGFINMFVINNSANEKLFTGVGMKSNTAGAGNAPSRREFAQKWTNTSSQITSFQINRVGGTGTFDTNSIIKVWGSN